MQRVKMKRSDWVEPNAKRYKGDTAIFKNVMVLLDSYVTDRKNGQVAMPSSMDLAGLRKPEKGRYKGKIEFTTMMTKEDVLQKLHSIFPILQNTRLSCASARKTRRLLEFHGEPRMWDGELIRRHIHGNSILYLLAKGNLETRRVSEDSISEVLHAGKGLNSGDEWMEVLYRAGTDESPSFEVTNNNEVWLIRNPALYFPLDQDLSLLPRNSTRANPVVHLWKTFISVAPDTLITERHPNLEEILVVKLREPESAKDNAWKLKEALRSMNWTKSTVPQCKRGMSQMNFSVLVRAVLEYLKDNHPTTPEEFNFQAELKAASHWHWYKDNEPTQFVSGPFDEEQLKKVAEVALSSWTHKLNEMKSEAEKLQAKMQEAGEENELSCNIEEQISDLEEAIFSLQLYYNMTLEAGRFTDIDSANLETDTHPLSM
ncbi:uncharacterized protein LOC144636041 [Oculina patagonica]